MFFLQRILKLYFYTTTGSISVQAGFLQKMKYVQFVQQPLHQIYNVKIFLELYSKTFSYHFKTMYLKTVYVCTAL